MRNSLDGVWLGAPPHPALPDVPVGAWITALLLDTGSALSGDRALGAAADRGLAVGTIAAVPAAVTGLNDLRDLIGQSRRIATLSTASLAHLGGKLSFALGIRLNRTVGQAVPGSFVPVLDAADLQAEELREVDVDGVPVLLARSQGGALCALANTCTHLGCPLAEGSRDGDTVTSHGAAGASISAGIRRPRRGCPHPRRRPRRRQARARRAEAARIDLYGVTGEPEREGVQFMRDCNVSCSRASMASSRH